MGQLLDGLSGPFAIFASLREIELLYNARNVSRKDAKIAKARQEENLGTNLC
jgi:hypothetical protein